MAWPATMRFVGQPPPPPPQPSDLRRLIATARRNTFQHADIGWVNDLAIERLELVVEQLGQDQALLKAGSTSAVPRPPSTGHG
jgi:hypothetical protein